MGWTSLHKQLLFIALGLSVAMTLHYRENKLNIPGNISCAKLQPWTNLQVPPDNQAGPYALVWKDPNGERIANAF
jgi:hypothetical protein